MKESVENVESAEERPQRLKIDAVTIENVAKLYEPEIQEDIVWLGNYTRERCSKNFDILKSVVRKEGFKNASANFFYKIFTGRYRDPKTGKYLGRIENFRQIVSKLRKNYIITSRSGKTPFVETGTWNEIRDYIDSRREPDTVNKFGLIVKPTGAQGTECMKQYRDLNNSGKCVLVDAPETPTLGKFFTDLAMVYGGALSWSFQKKYEHILGAVDHTKTILVDNIQRLYSAKRAGDQPIFHFLQKIQEAKNCTIICSCTDVFYNGTLMLKARDNFFEQFIGRIGGLNEVLVLDEFAPRADLLAIARSFNLVKPEQAIDLLEKLSRKPGRIRVVFGALQKAKRAAVAENDDLRIEHLREAAQETKIEVQG
jgi:hypothetical protein